MTLELILTPNRRLVLREEADGDAARPDRWTKRVVAAFEESREAGLFVLAARRPEVPLSPSVGFWRDLAGAYLAQRCRTPEGADPEPLAAPDPLELERLVASAPPMPGAEYLDRILLEEIWQGLDAWVCCRIEASSETLSGWLRREAPLWHQVGRVCFHLAENRKDPDFPFAFLATYAPRLSRTGRVQYQPLRRALEEYAGHRNRAALVRLLSPVHEAAKKSPFVKELVDSGDLFEALAWTPRDAYRLLKDVPLFEQTGLLVRLPDWWRKRPRPRVRVAIGETRQSRFSAEAMLDFRVDVALGDQDVSADEWRRLMAADDGLVLFKGQWVEVDHEKLSQALARWKAVEEKAADGEISFVEGMRLLAGAPVDLAGQDESGENTPDWCEVIAGRGLEKVLAGLRDPARVEAVSPGRALRGRLRPYQEVGHRWLWFLESLGLGGCLADDMGLGKTVQVIALLLTIRKNNRVGRHKKPSLLVLPASLLGNWKAELERFAPSLEVCFVHRSETDAATLEALAARPRESLAGCDLVITTYAMLARNEWLREVAWRAVILDEAQAIKNPSARQTRAVKKLESDARFALTGTPIENRLADLWSLFDFLCPGLLGSSQRFKGFIKSLANRPHDKYAPLRKLVGPYILRRLKSDKTIISDLPEKTDMKVYCGLAKRQAALYERAVRELAEALESREGVQRRGLVLAYLMRFKQICNHPSNFLGDGGYEPALSGKFQRLESLCEEISSRQEKVLVFTQFREMTGPLASYLAGLFAREGPVLHGGVPVARRARLIDSFQRDDGPPYFVVSLKAGGIGLNLTQASHVIHFDRWWNPAVENQATDRAFRIGQERHVLVHKFVCRGTVEERIDELIEEKTALAGEILEGEATAALTEMPDEELLRLVALDLDRASV